MLTLEAFADWCEKQPAEKDYDWTDIKNCACGQYERHIGFSGLWSGSPFWREANRAALHCRTFGALAARLRGDPQ